MNEPRRLIDAGHGLGSELLSAASRELAPERVRARVRKSVDMALAGVAVGGVTADGSADMGSALGPAALQPSAALGVWGKLGTVMKASTLVPLGAVTLAGAGVIGVLQLRSAAEGAREDVAPSVTPSTREEVLPPAAPREVEAPRDTVEALSASPAGADESVAGTEPADTSVTTRSAASRAPRRTSAAGPNASLQPNVQKDDQLGEQLDKLRDARRSLEAGNPDRALRVLDEYARRFPEGSLAPEAALLLRKAHAAKAAARRGGLPQSISS